MQTAPIIDVCVWEGEGGIGVVPIIQPMKEMQ